MGEWEWFAVVAVGTAVFCFATFMVLFRRRETAPRLASADSPADSHPDLILGDMTDVLAGGLPGASRDRAEILPELVRAGLYSPSALAEYRAVRAVLILVPLFAAVTISLLVEPRQIPTVGGGGVLLAILGYSIPRVYVTLKARGRSSEIERGLPIFADMLSIALLAGQGLLGALRRVTTQLRNTFPQLAEELEIVIRQADMLNLSVAYEQWADRCQLAEVRNLSVILNQSQKLGNDITSALLEYASNLRSGARQRADAKAQRASFWMLFPTILCLWIPAAIVLIAPVYYEFAARRAKARDQMPNLAPGGPAGDRFDMERGRARGKAMAEQGK